VPSARRPDPQTDYEDPVDRLYRRAAGRRREKRQKDKEPEKVPSTTASVAYYFGMVGLVPCVGLVFAPVAVVLGVVGLTHTRNPLVSGKGKAKSGIWFGMIGMAINYLIPALFYGWAWARTL
jgi:hypothetical protein